MRYVIENAFLRAEFDTLGAELKSLKDKEGREYMWQADPRFWGRTSPVLFPVVGCLSGGTYELFGKEYQMQKHGFARNMEFAMTEQTETAIWFALTESEETLASYPFCFLLEIGYCLEERKLAVKWRLHNTGERELYFSLGGHPAFNTPFAAAGKQTDCFLKFDRVDSFKKTAITEQGITDTRVMTTLENGRLKLTESTFALDAIIIEDGQVKQVGLCNPDGSPYVTVSFDMPLVGIWSKSADAPFVCIEPWCGLGDRIGGTKEFKERPYTNTLAAGGVFEQGYCIETY